MDHMPKQTQTQSENIIKYKQMLYLNLIVMLTLDYLISE